MPSPEEISRQLNDVKFMYEQAILALDDAAEKLSYAMENAVTPFIDDMIEYAETGYIDMQRYDYSPFEYALKCPGYSRDDNTALGYAQNGEQLMKDAQKELAKIAESIENEYVDYGAVD